MKTRHANVIIAAFPPDASSDPILFFPLISSREAAMETATLTCSLLGVASELMLYLEIN